MARIVWDAFLDRMYEIGVSRGLLHLNEELFPWNGLVSVTESSENSDILPIYQDGTRIANDTLLRDFAATVSAFTYPDEFEPFLDQNDPGMFDISYRTEIGEVGYKLHLVYNCSTQPSDRAHNSLAGSVDPLLFSWDINAVSKREHDGVATTAHFIVDSTKADPEALSDIEDILYGTEETEPRFITPFELRYLLGGMNPLEIVPDVETGLAGIIPAGRKDLAGSIGIGLYKRPPGSRLSDRALGPGLNRLE